MSMNKAKLLTAVSVVALLPAVAFAESNSTLFVNGSIWTANDAQPTAEAVVVDGNTISFVGSEVEARKVAGDAKVVDLNGQMLMPGFHDTHIHMDSVAETLSLKCDLGGLGSPERVMAKLVECEADLAEGEWLIAVGWALGAFPDAAPTAAMIEEAFPGRPFYAIAEDGHNGWASPKAFELAGITKDTPDPENGEILHTEDGELQGTLREYAMFMLDDVLPKYTDDQMTEGYKDAMAAVNEKGITTVTHAWGTDDFLRQYGALYDTGEATVRTNVAMYLDPEQTGGLEAYRDYFKTDQEWLEIDQIKLWLDGVYESQTAATTEEYIGLHHHGQLFYSEEVLMEWIPELEDMGYQIHMHTIGDRAVKQALDMLENSREVRGKPNNLPYLIHTYHADPADFPRIKEANATVNMTMLWRQNNDSMVYLNKPYLTEEIFSSLMPMAEVIEAGIRVAGGSDAMVGQFNPLASIKVAVTGEVVPYFEGGDFWEEQEKWDGKMVALEGMLKSYTIWAAESTGDESWVGSLEVGKKADMVVLEKDLFEIDPMDIYDVQVTTTYVDGNAVFQR
ncbi:MAG: amidohydrolase [Shimia sp.]|uniref:amidohydrolase n=1 Tax=Shimia sp. TaxID=1954381 RepID=UPI004057E519